MARGLTCLLVLIHVFGGTSFHLTIMHTNDMHSRFEEISRSTGPCKENTQCFGGFARVAHFVKSHRDNATLFLNAGDSFQGTALFTIFGTEIVRKLIDKMGIDAMSLGNHEFDLGPAQLGQYLSKVETPVVTCNVDAPYEPLINANIRPSRTFTVGGLKIGVIGYLTPETKGISVADNVTISDEIPAIRTAAQDLKKQGVHILIAVGHSGWEKDLEIAKLVEEIDVVVGGHSDTFVYTGTPPDDMEKPVGPYPTMVRQASGKQVPVVQAYGYTKYVGVLRLQFDPYNFRLLNATGNPVLMTRNIKQNQEILDLIQPYKDKVKDIVKREIGTTRVDLSGACRSEECNLGDFFTDLGVDYVVSQNESLRMGEYLPIAMVNSGNIRSSLPLSTLVEGKIIYNDLLTVFPFPGAFTHLRMKGSDLMEVLAHSYGEIGKGGFLQFSNLKVIYPSKKPKRTNIAAFAFKKDKSREKLKAEQIYDVITLEFVYLGGDGFNFTKGKFIRTYPKPVLTIIEEGIKRNSPINITTSNRITFEEDPENSPSAASRTVLNLIFLSFQFCITMRIWRSL